MSSEKNTETEFLKKYFESNVWFETTFMGVKCLKSVTDLWNYQEIIFNLKPSIIIEFGTYFGGATLYFTTLMRQIRNDFRVLTVDIDHSNTDSQVKESSYVELLTCSSTNEKVVQTVKRLRSDYPGKIFAIIDSDHHKNHVLSELKLLKKVLKKDDYVIVEDGIVNGNPIMPDFGEGPLEAIREYITEFPEDYVIDTYRENKFGITFSPSGYLIKK